MEFMAIYALILFIFVAMQAFYFNERNNLDQEGTAISAQKAAQDAADKLSLVSESEGMELQSEVYASLPPTGTPYTLTIRNSSATISYSYGGEQKTASAPARALRVDNGSGATAFNLSAGTYGFNNTRGTVFVTRKY